MPNWVENHLSYSGDKNEIAEMREKIKYDDLTTGTIDFNKIIPMPESLNIECGGITDKGIEMVKNYLENMPEELLHKEGTYEEFLEDLRNHSADITDEEEKKIWDIGVTAVDNLHKYDAPTWYEWRNENWNTKWNACGYDENTNYSGNSVIWFQTAWSAPIPVIQKLSEMYSNIELTLEFADEDLGQNCGKIKFKNGDIIAEYTPHTGKEAIEFAAKVWDYDLADFQLHINANQNDYVYTGEADYELIEIFGKPALFTNERLTLNDIPLGLNLYHIRKSDDDDEILSTLEPNVRVNHGGSILTSESIDFGEKGYIEFTDETKPNFLGQGLSIDDYVTENFTMDISGQQTGGMNLCQ